MQYNGLTQLVAIATRITKDSATLMDHKFHIRFFDTPHRVLLEACSSDQSIIFVKLTFIRKNWMILKLNMKFFFRLHWKRKKTSLGITFKRLEMPILFCEFGEHFEFFLESTQVSFDQCSFVKHCKNKTCHLIWFPKKNKVAVSKKRHSIFMKRARLLKTVRKTNCYC